MKFKKRIIFAGISCLAFTALGSINTQNLSKNTGINQCQTVNASATNDLSSLKPKQVAAAVLTIGADSNEAWDSIEDSASDDGTLSVLIDDMSGDGGFTELGTGTFYEFNLNGMTGGMLNGYTISQDGETIYLYSESMHGSGERTVAPFKTISAKKVVKVANTNENIDSIVANTEIK